MTPEDFSAALKRIGKSQITFGKSIGRQEETVSRWATGSQEIPKYVEVLLGLAQEVVDLREAINQRTPAPLTEADKNSRRLDFIVVQPLGAEDGGGFIAFAHGMPACVGDGKTAVDAVADLESSIAHWREIIQLRHRKPTADTPPRSPLKSGNRPSS